MSFTSVLPTPQVILKSRLPPVGVWVYGYFLRIVRRGDIILPEDQNNIVYAWLAKLDALAEIEGKLRKVEPEKADTLAAYISELKAIVDQMPLVKEGDWVYAEHFNLHVRALGKLIEIEEWMATEIASGDPEMVRLLDEMKSYFQRVEERKSGEIVTSADWNAIRYALSLAPLLDELAEEHVPK